MGWSDRFLEALQGDVHTPRFYLEVAKEPSCPGATGVIFYSHQSTAESDPAYAISTMGVRVSSGSISLLSWSQSFGGLVVGIHGGSDHAITILQSCVRGSIVRLFCGFDGWDYADFETIFIGQVRQFRGTPERGYRLECWDIVRALGTRWTTTANQAALFYNLRVLATTTIATSAYSINDSTLEVASSASFERETGGNYLIRVTDNSSGTFLRVASSVSSDVFTILNPTSEVYGTEMEAADVGNKVEHMAILQDGPVDIVKKLLLSTGTGTAHASFDKYPANWGFGVPLDWVDLDDIDEVMSSYQVDLTWDLDVVVTAEQTNPISWLQGILGPCGFWLVQRQGQISMRPAQNPYLSSIAADFHIRDIDIDSVLDWQAWDGSRAVEYLSIKVNDAAASYSVTSTEAIATLPSTGTYEITLDHVWKTASTNREKATADVDLRTEIWAHRIPERVSLLLTGLTYAGLCEGDLGLLTSAIIPSRDISGMDSRRCMVLSCTPDWLGGVVRLDLGIVATWASDFPP